MLIASLVLASAAACVLTHAAIYYHRVQYKTTWDSFFYIAFGIFPSGILLAIAALLFIFDWSWIVGILCIAAIASAVIIAFWFRDR